MELDQEPDFEDSMIDDDMKSCCDLDEFEKKIKSIPQNKQS